MENFVKKRGNNIELFLCRPHQYPRYFYRHGHLERSTYSRMTATPTALDRFGRGRFFILSFYNSIPLYQGYSETK